MGRIEQLKNIFRGRNWSWWGQRAHDALGISRFAELKMIVCCDWGYDIKDKWGDLAVSLEKDSRIRRSFSNEDINAALAGPLKKRVIESKPEDLYCIMYRSLKGLEDIRSRGFKIVSSPVDLKNRFDDKILFRKIVSDLALTPIPGDTLLLSDSSYRELSRSLGKKMVLKYPVASSGKKTHLVRDSESLSALRREYGGSQVIVERFLDGIPVNINAVVSRSGIYLSPPSVQIIGAGILGLDVFGFGGNDFSAFGNLSARARSRIYTDTVKLGKRMRQDGFLGMMGIDFIADGTRVYPVEINPRFQNSTSLLTLLELDSDAVPLAARHIAEFTGIRLPERGAYDPDSINTEGAQITLRSRTRKTIKMKSVIRPGIYRMNTGSPVFIRSGNSLLDCRRGEFALCGGIPFKDTDIAPGAPLFKLHFREHIYDTAVNRISGKIENTIKKIYNVLIGENFNDTT